MNKLVLTINLLILFGVVTVNADYVAPEIKTQVNQQTDLFEKSINDFKSLEQQLEAGKQNSINALGDGKSNMPQGLSYITNKSKNELEQESSKLQAIDTNDLDGRGRAEMIKSNSMNELYTDYSRTLNKQHMKDAISISEAQDGLLSNLLGKLKDIGVDCKTVKGDKKHEPEYFLQIKTTSHKNTIYNQTFCEELRNKYSCVDTVTLKCLQFSEKPAELTVSQSNMKYSPNIAGLARRISFAEKYGSHSGSSSYGGGTSFLGLVNKASGTTYHAHEATWHINFNISADVAMLTKVQLNDVSYGTFVMFKLNGEVIFVGPSSGNNLFLNGHRPIITKGDRRYAGLFGRKVNITTNYPIVNTGVAEYALGLDSISNSSKATLINLLPYVRQGSNILEIKAISRSNNKVRFNLDISERICTKWQENWHEQCRLE